MRNDWKGFLLVMTLVGLSASVSAQEAVTIFFDNGGAEAGVTPPGSTSFSFMGSNWSGGVVESEGVPRLYASGSWSYEVPMGPATVTFDSPVMDVRFFYVHGNGFAAGVATARAADGTVLEMANSEMATSFGNPEHFVEFTTNQPIASVEFSAGVIDNFSFTAFEEGDFDFALAEGAWFNPATDGEGILFDFGPTLDLLFMAWFTFTLESVEPVDPPAMDIGSAGQRWMTSLLSLDGNIASGSLLGRQAGAFDSPPTESEANVNIGTITIEFIDCDLARVDYVINTAGVSGSFDIQPLEQAVNPNGFSCSLDGTPTVN